MRRASLRLSGVLGHPVKAHIVLELPGNELWPLDKVPWACGSELHSIFQHPIDATGTGRHQGIKDHLGQAPAIAQIHKNQVPVIAP